MNRRKFIAASALVGAGVVSSQYAKANPQQSFQDRPIIKPKKLSKGDTIGLITPGSAISRGAFEKAVENVESLGFKVKYSDNMRVRKGFLAGTDAQRIDDIHVMFSDPAIDGIVCARGGYGSGRLLPGLNYELIKANPKVFVGYSDITALLFGIHKNTGLVCFHGPVGASDFTDFTSDIFEKVLIKAKSKVAIKRPKDWKELSDSVYDEVRVVQGTATGSLVGGNLSLMSSLMGTPYDIDFAAKIVFIEEVGESAYRVDRMLTQLLLSGKLDKAAGIAMGVFYDCEDQPGDDGYGLSLSLKEVVKDRFGKLNIPVIYGLPIGHIKDNATLPLGVEAELNVEKSQLTLLEKAVV